MLKDFLKKGNCFKLICGAGNKDFSEIEKLVSIYSAAGCQFFDVSADINAVKAAKNGIENSGKTNNRYICISVGTDYDIHFSKAIINQKQCIKCGICTNKCDRNAIIKKFNNFQINKSRCIGCQKCKNICPKNAIDFQYISTNFNTILTDEIIKMIDCIEFHISTTNKEEIISKWNLLNQKFDGFLSISINRKNMGDNEIMSTLTEMLKDRRPYTTIIQADGNPISGGKNNFQTTIQSVATTELINRINLPVYIFVSGGTNQKTKELLNLCKIKICGISMGSYARKAVKEYLNEDIFTERKLFKKAVNKAKSLIKKSV